MEVYTEPVIHNIKKWLITDELTCLKCKENYKEFENIGQWKCKYHPGFIRIKKTHKGNEYKYWDCCQKKIDNSMDWNIGCTSCDHISVGTHEQNKFLSLPLLFFYNEDREGIDKKKINLKGVIKKKPIGDCIYKFNENDLDYLKTELIIKRIKF